MSKQQPKLLEEPTISQAIPVLTKLFDSMSFFYTRLKDHPQEQDVETHMGLFESYFAELSDILRYSSKAVQQRNEFYAQLREERAKLDEERKRFAESTSPSQVMTCLRKYQNIFTAWYESHGFHYARLKDTYVHGFLFDISDELNKTNEPHLAGDKPFAKWCQTKCTPIQHMYAVDIYEDAYHDNLLDTDTNKSILQDIITIFPHAYIREFRSTRDENMMKLRWQLYVPFEDLDALYQQYLTESENRHE